GTNPVRSLRGPRTASQNFCEESPPRSGRGLRTLKSPRSTQPLGAVRWSWLLGHPGLVLGLEPVAHAGFGDEVAGVRRIGFQLAADLGDEQAQVVGLLLIIGPPDLLQQLPLADQPAGVADQQLNELPLGRGEADLPAVS